MTIPSLQRVERDPVPLATLTTLRLGGAARRLVEATSETEVVAAVRRADAAGEPLLILAGGSNVVVADGGFDGTALVVATRGVRRGEAPGGRVRLDVQAGEPWDPFVATCGEEGLTGLECLSGIPGSVGATPIQNVGAYGQEVAETIAAVRVFDRERDALETLSPEACAFGYRSSAFKRRPGRWVVLAVSFALERSALSAPVRYPELARRLGVQSGARAPLADVRTAVLHLRRAKGMVTDPGDLDSVSAGSFFMNPVLSAGEFAALERRVAERLGFGVQPPAYPGPDGAVKTSAAWLVERAGFARGHGDPRGIAISSKHSLALTNRGRGTAWELLTLAREIRDGVREAFGVELVPEPVLVAHSWEDGR